MAKIAELFDGTQMEFPDDTPDEVIAQTAQKETKRIQGPSVMETVASLPERGWKGLVSGVTTTGAAFDWAQQAGFDPEMVETFKANPESPAAQEYFKRKAESDQSARVAKMMQGELKNARPLGAQNSLFDEIVGGAAESLGASVVPTVALGAINPALGAAAGLATNFAMEAGGQWDEAMGKGAAPEDVTRSMGFGGAVSTMLELPVIGQMKRLMEAGKPTLKEVGKAALQLMGKEAGQEGATQLAMDTEANVSGWGKYSLGEMAKRTGMAAAQGAVMGGVMGGSARVLSRVQEKNQEILQERALVDAVSEQLAAAQGVEADTIRDTVGAVIQNLKTQEIDPETAAIQREQLMGVAENLPATEYGTQLAALLDSKFPRGIRTDTEADVGIAGEDVPERRQDYLERQLAGNELSLGDRVIYAGNNPNAVGLKLNQIEDLPDGAVVVVGGNLQSQAALFPGLMPEAVGEAVTKLRDLAGMTMPIIITMEQLEGGQTGLHTTMQLPDGRMAHVINPRELPSAKAKYGYGNRTTIAEFIGTLTHEFGHAIEEEKLVQGISRQAAQAGMDLTTTVNTVGALRNALATRSVTPEMVAGIRAFAPVEADLIERWNTLQQAAVNGTISGKDFATAWLGPRKFSWSFDNVRGTKDIFTYVQRMAAQRGNNKSIDNMTAQEVIEAVTGMTGTEAIDYMLGFKEFMAEQYSRAAHDRNYLKGTKLGQWFQSVLDSLREFFNSVKDQGFIKPDVTFERWLDAQTPTGKQAKKPRKWGQITLSKEVQAQQKKLKAKLEADRAALAAEGEQELETDTSDEAPEPPLPMDEEAAIDPVSQEGVHEMLNTALDMGVVKRNSKEHNALKGLIAKGELETARDIIWNALMAENGLNFDRAPAMVDETGVTVADVAGLTNEEMSDPGTVHLAQRMWEKMKFNSPFFRRWNRGNMLVDSITGEPVVLYHGTGQEISFFDPTLLGAATMAESARRGFFFTANPANAAWYAKGGGAKVGIYYEKEADARKAQYLRQQIQDIEQILTDAYESGGKVILNDGTERLIDKRLWRGKQARLKRELTIHQELSPKKPYKPTIGAYYIRMENPFVLDFLGREWEEGIFVATLKKAVMLGHDGVVFKNAKDPMLDDIYVAFNPEQIKSTDNVGTFAEHDRVSYDRGVPLQSAMKMLDNGLAKILPETPFKGALNFIARVSDSLVQLQQRAAKPLANGELDVPMQQMLKALQKGEAFKNSLQQPAEVLVKELKRRSQKELDSIYGFLEMEWKSGKMLFDLQGWTGGPEVEGREQIWGDLEDGGRDVSSATGKQVVHWEFGPPLDQARQKLLGEALRKAGIDTNTPRGAELFQLALQVKNTQLSQFTALQKVLENKLVARWGSNPAVAVMEIEKLYQSMQKIRLTPFFPQGKYGNYVITVQKPKDNPQKGERKWETSRVEYYESLAEMEAGLKEWNGKKGLKVSWKKLDDYKGIPLTLPRNLLESLEQTQLFTKDQLQTMSDMMVPAGHEKIVVRYGKQSEVIEGGERDLIRNYSNFMWHNANFIWKLDFRTDFAKAINAHNAALRRAQQDISPAGIPLAKELQRNHDIMNRVKEYVLYPPYEFQGIRTAAALVYLAYNVKTALMNFGTMLNSWAAITTEYGERKGHGYYLKGMYDAGRLLTMQKSLQTKHIVGEISPEDSPLVWMYNKAVSEGVLDQSYAFFLAGQANTPTALRGIKGGVIGKLSYHAMELGMFPFRMVEKMNRLATLTMFFEAERGRGATISEAYEAAVQRTNLLQNAYDAGNRSELFRGKKAILTMFASYSQFMVWNMTGGYSKAMASDVRVRAEAMKLAGMDEQALAMRVESVLGKGGYTAKLWVMYMILGGMLAPPFAENVLEFLQWIWRKVYKTNLRLELRQFIQELGADPDLVMHGVLHNVAGFDLSGSFSLGRVIPGVDLLNREIQSFQDAVGAFAVKGAGPFGGFTEDLFKFLEEGSKYMQGQARGGEVLGQLPGVIGAIGKTYDAHVLQTLRPDAPIIDKAGARVLEDPPGSGNFRGLTEWEMVGMLMGANPSILSTNRAMNYAEAGEQIYWRTRRQLLLDNRNEAILTQDTDRVEAADKSIQKFNDSLPEGYDSLAITGRVKADSLRAKRKQVQKREAGQGPRNMRSVLGDVKTAWGGGTAP